jgi:TPR repeat protein
MAGECRSLLRPLLLQAEPDSGELARVRSLCAAEAAAGDAEATYQLSFFSLGLGGSWHPDEAIPLIRSAASDGITEAQYWLAWQSEAGPALPHDNAIALGWYEKAAAGNHRLALQRLADAWERGELGLPADARKAVELRARIRRCEEQTALRGD